MHDMPDVRGEDIASLLKKRSAMTALDRLVSRDSSSNQFNNFISADPDSSSR
jgi:hypothetical protein